LISISRAARREAGMREYSAAGGAKLDASEEETHERVRFGSVWSSRS